MKILIVEDQFIEAYDLQLILEKVGYKITGLAHSVKQAEEMIAIEKPDLVCLDIFLDDNETGIDLAKRLKKENIGFIYISANSGKTILEEVKKTQPYGFIVKPFRESDVLTTVEIAEYRHNHNTETILQNINILQHNLEAISSTSIKWEHSLSQFGRAVQSYIPFDYMEIECPESYIGETYTTVGLFRRNFEEYTVINADRFSEMTILSTEELARLKNESPRHYIASVFENHNFIQYCQQSGLKRLVAQSFGIKSCLVLPIAFENNESFLFTFYSKQSDSYTAEHLQLLTNLENCLLKFVKAYECLLPKKISKINKVPLSVPLPAPTTVYKDIVGNSKAMLTVFDHLHKVSRTDTSVLILGESGTGKEKIAKTIHDLSSRNDKPFVTVNCGAIPDNLAESLLFGHEKGSFTGAIDRKIGKFELADKGTIFLDEIGEMPLSLQVKLLRVLQENEVERVGGRFPIKINVRIIAATNKNLEEEVAAGRFRMDLYYRLHIFPILMPPLRQRKDDIPALTNHFIEIYCKKIGTKKLSISSKALDQLTSYHWPGNVRQLDHVIQRSILLTDGPLIKEIAIPRYEQSISQESNQYSVNEDSVKTISENERDYICYILKQCNGKVYGTGGAAQLLDIPASTLNSKIKKLGIIVKSL